MKSILLILCVFTKVEPCLKYLKLNGHLVLTLKLIGRNSEYQTFIEKKIYMYFEKNLPCNMLLFVVVVVVWQVFFSSKHTHSLCRHESDVVDTSIGQYRIRTNVGGAQNRRIRQAGDQIRRQRQCCAF
jgi:hypothetical protein